MEQQKNQLIEKLEDDFKVCTRTYSEKILGYRIFLDEEVIFVINKRYSEEIIKDTLNRLIILSKKYIEYGFIMLLSNYELYCSPYYKYSDFKGHYFLNPNITEKQGNVIQMDKSLIENKMNRKKIDNIIKGMNNIE